MQVSIIWCVVQKNWGNILLGIENYDPIQLKISHIIDKQVKFRHVPVISLSCYCKQIINQHSCQNYVHPSDTIKDWWWIQGLAKIQQTLPVRINFQYGIYSEDYCTFHYCLKIVCSTLFISVKFVVTCVCIWTYFFSLESQFSTS